jgi:voltage-gated potassium channel
MKAFRNLRTIGALLLLVAVVGTAGYHYIEGWPWFDGFYMVVTTLTTIGYQEVHPLSHAGRVFNVFVILAGVSLLLLGVGALSQALLEFELQSFFGRRRMEREIGRLEGHFIICGMGRVGRSVARELGRKPVPFVIVENAEIKRQRFVHENWLVIAGDATLEETLRQAQIDCCHHYRCDESLYCADGTRAQSTFEDHRAGQRGRGREASADRRG